MFDVRIYASPSYHTHMHRPLILIVALLSLPGLASAESPASQPTTRTAQTTTRRVNTFRPMDFMRSYDQLAGQDPAAYLDLYYLDGNDDTQRLADVESKFDSQVGMMQKIVQDKWGESAAVDILHALGLRSLNDVQAGVVKEMNGHATVIFADGTPGPELFRTPHGWRLDMGAFRESLGIPVDDYLKQIRKLSKILPDVADGIASGKFPSSSDVVSDIAKRIDATAQ